MEPERELPSDVLADILRRLSPRSLAVSRCIRRTWRDVVDAHQLLRTDLLPLSVRGIFMHYCALDFPEFLARPTTGPEICGGLDFIPPKFREIKDHCNGLLLLCIAKDQHDYAVANPATRRAARLPPRPTSSTTTTTAFDEAACLVFDPTVSPHYEVFLVPTLAEELDRVRTTTAGTGGAAN